MTDRERQHRMPGHLIQDLLEERAWSKRVLAVVLGMDETGLGHIISGKRPMRADLALALGDVLGVEPERLLELQQGYDLAQARLNARPDPTRATRAHLFGGLPVADMIKRGWIRAEDIRDAARVEAELARFFGAASVEEIEILPHAAKKTNVFGA